MINHERMTMTDPYLDQRLTRLETSQLDLGSRLSRLEARNEPVGTQATQPGWLKPALIVGAIVAVIWLLDELPGPALWDRLF